VLPPPATLPGPSRGAMAGFRKHGDARLKEMMARANLLNQVLNNTSTGKMPRSSMSRRLHEYLRRSLIDAGKDFEISVCRPRGVAFVHVYKAAGTTAKAFVEAGCPEPRHHFSCCGCDSETSAVYCHTLVDGAKWKHNVTTTFTIVRDPVDRFRSGIFELALRNDPWMLANIDRAKRENISVAEATIDDLLGRSPWFLPDPHIMEQTFFLVDKRKPPYALTYIAKLGPELTDDLAALGHSLFGMPRAAVEAIPHMRNSQDANYGRDKKYIHDQPLDLKTIAKIKQYYHVDYAWIDPASHRQGRARPL